MKDKFSSLENIFYNVAVAAQSMDEPIYERAGREIEAAIADLRSDPEYLMHSAALDIVAAPIITDFSTKLVMFGNGNIHTISDAQIKIVDHAINFIINEINGGERVLLSLLCDLRPGSVKVMMEKESNTLISSLLKKTLRNSVNCLGMLTARVIALQPDSRVLKGSGYTAEQADLLIKIKPKELLLKHGSNRIKKFLISNELGM